MSFFNKNKKQKFINSKDYRICARCGSPIKATDRSCLKCGALNLDHPENQYLKKYMSFKKIEKDNRNKFDQTMEQKIDDVYVGGKKLEEASFSSDKEKENPKEDEYREIISIPSSLVIVILILVALIIYFLVWK